MITVGVQLSSLEANNDEVVKFKSYDFTRGNQNLLASKKFGKVCKKGQQCIRNFVKVRKMGQQYRSCHIK